MVIVDQSELVTFAPAPQQHSSKGSSILRTETEAQSQTKTSFQISVRSPSLKAALLMKDCGIRMEVDWALKRNGNRVTRADYVRGDFRKRPFGLAMGVQSLTITVNNSSFSFSNTDVMQILSGLWGYGETCYQGKEADKAPFRFMSVKDRTEASDFPEFWKSAAGVDTRGTAGNAGDRVLCADFFMPLPVGLFLSAALPNLRSMSGYESIAVPHINELTVNCTMKPDWLKYLLQSRPQSTASRPGVYRQDKSLGVYGEAVLPVRGWDNQNANFISNVTGNGALSFADANYGIGVNVHAGNPATGYMSVFKPRLCCVWSSVPSGIPPTYSLGFHRFVSYQEDGTMANGSLTKQVHFSNIQLDVTPNVFIVVCRDIQDWHSSNYFCPIKWSTVKISSTTSSAPVGNIADDMRCNAQDQYRIYKSATGDSEISYKNWFRYRQAICFSGTELSSALAFRNCYNPVSLSVSFEFYRDAEQHAPWSGLASYVGVDAGQVDYKAYLIQVGDSVCTLSEGAAKVADVRLQPQQIVSSMSGGSVVRKDQMADRFGR